MCRPAGNFRRAPACHTRVVTETSAPVGQPAPVAGPVLAEVIARHGQRIVDVQHIGVEPEPAVGPAGWFTVGGCALVLGLGLMISGVRAEPPPAVDAALTEAAEQPAPTTPARGGAAGLGALLILLGVVPLVLGMSRARAVPRDRYTIGEGHAVHLAVPMPAGCEREGVPLVRALEHQLVLGLVPGMTGELRDGERTLELADLIAQGRSSYALPAGARCEAVFGPLRFEIHAVERAHLEPARRPLDRLYWLSNLGVVAALGGLFLLGETRAPGVLELEEFSERRVRATAYLTALPPPPPPQKPPAPAPKDRPAPRAAEPSRPATAPPPATVDTLAVDVAIAEKNVPKGTRRGIRNDYDFARTAGFLDDPGFNDAVGKATADAQEGLLGYDTDEDRKMWAAVLAAPVIDRPFGGLELAPTERGGGVHDDRPRPAKAARNIEIDLGKRPAGATAEQRALARRIVKLTYATPNVKGDLSPQMVQEAVRKQEEGLRRCFKEAVGTADRVGTIYLKLKTNGSGRVTQANLDFGGAQLGDIGPCLNKAAGAWKFPAPLDNQPMTIILEALYSARSY